MKRHIWDRINDKIKLNTVTGCWEWTGAVDTPGYAQINCDRKRLRVTRIVYELTYGACPTAMQVCHKCDNRRCVNPDHLFLGTNSENQRDASIKGRRGGQKLSMPHRALVDGMRAEGMSYHQIARVMGVASMTVYRFCNRPWRKAAA